MEDQRRITIKLIFDADTSEDDVNAVLSKHTKDGKILHFYPNREIGYNIITYAIVDIPAKSLIKFHDDKTVKSIDKMLSNSSETKSSDCCRPSG